MIRVDQDQTSEDAKTQFLSKILPNAAATSNETITVSPCPGFVLKTHILEPDEKSKSKLFVNICEHEFIPPPPLTTDEELIKAINEGDNSHYRVPLSLSSLKEDMDKSGNKCFVVDIVMNCDPYSKCSDSMDFKAFMMEMCLQWIEQKYNMKLDKNYSFPKLKAKGAISKHTIRKPTKPLIAKMKPILTASEYTILYDPNDDNPDYIIVDVQLPLINSIKDSILEIEKRRIIFSTPNIYNLQIKLSHDIDTLEGVAQFDKGTRILTITCTILK